jgi:hypothetical protein
MEARSAIHPSAEALRAFALGKMDDSTVSVLMSHLDSCPECCQAVAALSGDEFHGTTGSLWWSVNTAEPAAWRLPPDNMAAHKKVGEWNDMGIEMQGQSLRVAVNGRDVQKVMLNKTKTSTNPMPGLSRFSGRIGLLKRAAEVRYRKIEIKELPPN